MKNKWALVTGASSGLGVDFAKILAEQGYNLILTARRKDLLESVKNNIGSQFKNQVFVVSTDLSSFEGTEFLIQEIKSQNIPVDVLINNAGYGIFKDTTDIPISKQLNMIDLNIKSLVHLSQFYATEMKSRKYGYILNIASLAAFQPSPHLSVYGATKSFVLNFTEALHVEMKPFNVHVTALCPGITETEFFNTAGKPPLRMQMAMMKSEPVCRLGIKALFSGKMTVVPGLFNKILVFLNRFTPRSLVAKISGQMMKH